MSMEIHNVLKEEFFVQTYYECISCYGQNSCFGICEYCYYYCHLNHNTLIHNYTQSAQQQIVMACDCGRQKHLLNTCTKNSTGKEKVKQCMYVCNECFGDLDQYLKINKKPPGICKGCFKTCHQDHKGARFYEYSESMVCQCEDSGKPFTNYKSIRGFFKNVKLYDKLFSCSSGIDGDLN